VSQDETVDHEIELKFTQALQLTEQGAWEEAESAWTALLRMEPENGAALSNRGLVRISLNRLDEALADLQMAVQLSPDEPILHENLGTVYEARNDWDAALREYNTTLQLAPNNATALLSRGNVYLCRADYPAALADYEAAANAETGLVASREKMALVLAQLGRSDDSVGVLRQVVRKYPAYAEAHAALAAVLWGAKHDYLAAEDQWARIPSDDMRDQLSDRDMLEKYLRWPPRMIQYLTEFLNLHTASEEIESAGFVP
jgi:protein kinase